MILSVIKKAMLFLFLTKAFFVIGQKSSVDSLAGNWREQEYYSENIKKIVTSPGFKCKDFLVLKLNKNLKSEFIFKDPIDSFSFYGKIKLRKNRHVKSENSIRDLIYLGELEKCITPGLRHDFRNIFYAIEQYSVTANELIFFYYFSDKVLHRIVFSRIDNS